MDKLQKKIIRACTVSMSLGFVKGMLPDLKKIYEVVLLSSPGEEMEEIEKQGLARCIALPMERRISPIKDFISLTVEKGGRKNGHMSIYENAQDCLQFKLKDIKAADRMWQNALSMAKEDYQIENVKRSMLSYRYYKGCALKGEFSVFNPKRFEENEKLYNDMIDSGVTCDGEMRFNGEMLDDPFARYVVPNKWGIVSQDSAYGIVIKTYIKILDVIEKLIGIRPFLWA